MIGCPRYVFHNEAYKKFKHLDWINAGEAGIENLNLFKLDFNADRLEKMVSVCKKFGKKSTNDI